MNYYFNHYHIGKDDVFINRVVEEPPAWENYAMGTPLARSKVAVYEYAKADMQMLDWLQGVQSVPLVSERLKNLLEETAKEETEFHPVKIRCAENGQADGSFFFMNILRNVPCLDRKKSQFTLFMPGYDIVSDMQKLALNPKATGNRQIFRIAEFPSLILFGETLIQKIGEAGLTGLTFAEAEKYKSGF